MGNLASPSIFLRLYVDPIGTLRVIWTIPSTLTKAPIRIHLPGFKYDLPRIGGVPVPLSSKAIPLPKPKVKIPIDPGLHRISVETTMSGNYVLEINLDSSLEEDLEIHYSIPEIVNNDTVFYVIVYPLINLFSEPVSFNIELLARFSYKIRKYKFREWYFSRETGSRIKREKVAKTGKVGDLISVRFTKLVLNRDDEIDIHLTGSRFPVMIRRDIFWTILFLISLTIITSPIWAVFLRQC